MNKSIEILSPCGSKEVLLSAISAGCNAVYLAGKMFGARSYATNFSNEELKEAIKLCHLYNVLVYVTCNTLIYEKEIPEVINFIDFLYENDVDAVIIQDLGLASIIKQRYPGLKMHASTQINAQNISDVLTLEKLGFSRVVLGREVSLDTIKEIRSKTNIEIEVFVHGALCISYSGNCYFSKFNGGRSGNRGECAQPCRMIHKFNNKEKYFLSPKDLCTIDYLKDIIPYVDSLKIEGRMKSKEYVYYVTKAYKDSLFKKDFDKINATKKIMISFNRGFTKGFINDENNASITNTFNSNHLGVEIGKVINSTKRLNNMTLQAIKLNDDLLFKDSIRIVGSKNRANKVDAVIVNQMYVNNLLVKKACKGEIVYLSLHKKMDENDKVYLTKREESFSLPKIYITGKGYIENDYFIFDIIDDSMNKVSMQIKYQKTEKDFKQSIMKQLNKTGNTPFIFTRIDLSCNNVYLDIKDVNKLRRDILTRLYEKRVKRNFKREINNILDDNFQSDNVNINTYKEYSVLSYNNINNNPNIDYNLYTIKYSEVKKYSHIYYYLPRVIEDDNILSNMVSSSIGSITKIASPYLNVCNSYTVRVLKKLGFEKIGLSIELSFNDIKDLINAYKKRYNEVPCLEMLVYGHIELMHMKHCFINKEFNFKNLHCNLCKQNYLLDDKYPVYGDKHCHLSILSEKPINLLNKIDDYKNIGVTNFLINLINKEINIESIDNIEKLISTLKN